MIRTKQLFMMSYRLTAYAIGLVLTVVEVVVDQSSWLGSILIQVVTFIYYILKISEWLSTYINIQDRK